MQFKFDWTKISTDGEPFAVACDTRMPTLQELAYTPHVIIKLMRLSHALSAVLEECGKRNMKRQLGFFETCKCMRMYLSMWSALGLSLFLGRLNVKPNHLYDPVAVRKARLHRTLVPILSSILCVKYYWWINDNTRDLSLDLSTAAYKLLDLVSNPTTCNAPPRIINTADVLQQLCLVGKLLYDTVCSYLVIGPQ